MLKTKSVYEPIKKEDGLRVLATRYRGRGMKKTRYHVWMACLGPSEKLFKKFNAGKLSWGQFKKAYKDELLASSGDFDKKNNTIKNHGQKFTLRLLKKLSSKETVTLMCHCDKNEKECHRHILMEMILKA